MLLLDRAVNDITTISCHLQYVLITQAGHYKFAIPKTPLGHAG